MNTVVDELGELSNEINHKQPDRNMGKIETNSAPPCYRSSPDWPVPLHLFDEWDTLGKMSDEPPSPRRRHRKAKLSLPHVLTMFQKTEPVPVFQFDVWSYFTFSHGEGPCATDDCRDEHHHWHVGDDDEDDGAASDKEIMTTSQLVDILARINVDETERMDPSSSSFMEENENRPPAKQLSMDEMIDILRHINLCEQTKSAIQYDVINRMIYPDLQQWLQPLGSIALNSESCVSSVSWEESLSDDSSTFADDDDFDNEFQDDSHRSRLVDSESHNFVNN